MLAKATDLATQVYSRTGCQLEGLAGMGPGEASIIARPLRQCSRRSMIDLLGWE